MSSIERPINYYPPFVFGTYSHCAYCGNPSSCVDHVFPFSMLSVRERAQHSDATIGPQARCCSQCNGILGDKLFKTFQERCQHVSDRLLIKGRKHSPKWKWEKYEIRKLKGSLRTHVEMRERQHKEYLVRASWFGTATFFENIESLIYEAILDPDSEKFRKEYANFFAATLIQVKSRIAAREDGKRVRQDAFR